MPSSQSVVSGVQVDCFAAVCESEQFDADGES